MLYFLQGLTMGLAYVAPIGLQNLFVINTALSASRPRAFGTAAIVIFFDITLALACFFGIGAIMQRYTWLQMLILLVGSLIVLHIGISLLRTQAADLHQTRQPQSWRAVISTACVVTWFNPQAIIDGTMMLGAFHVTLPASQSSPFIAGVGTGLLPVVFRPDPAGDQISQSFQRPPAANHQLCVRPDYRLLRLQAAVEFFYIAAAIAANPSPHSQISASKLGKKYPPSVSAGISPAAANGGYLFVYFTLPVLYPCVQNWIILSL